MPNNNESGVRYIYILDEMCVSPYSQLTLRNPLAASTDYNTIVEYAKARRDYILEHGSYWFDDPEAALEELVAWDGIDRFMVGLSDQSYRIVYIIKSVPLLRTKDDIHV